MSGGSFDYAYGRVQTFAMDLQSRLDEHPDDYWEPAVTAELRRIADLAGYVGRLMFETEWLYSGDTGEDTFLLRVAGIERERRT